MSTSTLSLHEQTLGIARVSRILDELEQRLAGINAEREACSGQQRKYQLLGGILDSLRELETAGAADLFWNREVTRHAPDEQLRKAHEHLAAFDEKVADIEGRREQVQSEIDVETLNLRSLNNELVDIEEEVENLRNEFVVYRDAAEIPFRPLVMPWSRSGEDDRRYRKIFLASVSISLTIGSIVFLFKPAHEKRQEEFIPEHIAELVVKKKEEPKAPERKPQESKPQDRTTTAVANVKTPQPQPAHPTTAEGNTNTPSPVPGPIDSRQAARESAQTKGLLAHSNDLASLIDSNGPAKVGAEGVVSNTGQIAPGTASTRSLIVSQVGSGSGGINVAAISRNGDGGGGAGGRGTGTGGGGNSLTGGGTGGGSGRTITGGGMKVARVESGTGAAAADARPLSTGTAASRTDEEIQIVFDRYKAALYRIYNRELRNDPTLRGKMVLKLTIEPDGHVSACSVKSTDLASPALSAEVVERVLKFNFGVKQGVPSITIVYPIDFLPAA